MPDPTTIQPGQRYAYKLHPRSISWLVAVNRHTEPIEQNGAHPIVAPERLHEIKVGSTVLNVATGEQFEWDALRANMFADVWHVFTPLLALVALPEEDA